MDPKNKTVRRRKNDPKPSSDECPPVVTVAAPQKKATAPKATQDRLDINALEALAKGDHFDMASVMDDLSVSGKQREVGQRVTGVISSQTQEMFLVHIGGKMEATADRAEWPNSLIGDTLEAYIVGLTAEEIHLSKRLTGVAATSMIEDAHEEGIPIEGLVRSKNSGGFEVLIGKTRAFCPASHIHRLPGTEPDHWVGQTLLFKVIETGDKIVLSRRALLEEQIEAEVASFWVSAAVGQAVSGTITSVQEWGAYVDVDGVEGRLHKRDMSWDGGLDPLGTFVRGQVIRAEIVTLEPESHRIGLSVKDASDDPWRRLGVEFVVGGLYTGQVVRVEEFGAFVEIAPGLTGLVHVSRFKEEGQTLPTKKGEIKVRLRAIDMERRRLELGLPGSGDEETAPYIPAPDKGSFGTFGDMFKGFQAQDS